jgi:hydroxylamine oxidation protein HaoB
MIGFLSYLWLKPEPPPYRYQLALTGGVESFSALGLQDWPGLTVEKYEVLVESVDKPIAVGYRAKKGTSTPVLLHWENQASEPVISIENETSDLASVAAAVNKHMSKDAIILGWWDLSRQINLLTDHDTLFKSHIGEPVMAPSYWKSRAEEIERYEREFWGAPASQEEQQKFQRFADALSSEPIEGSKILRELAGGREGYVIVHVSDIYKLGLMRPSKLDMAFKDFPLTGNVHGLNGQIKAWMVNNKYEVYTLQALSEKSVRVYYLREGQSTNTLLARMLPFSQWAPLDLEPLQLIHKQGAYWVYKIPSA